MLTNKHLEDVCLVFHGAERCRYLTDDINDDSFVWICMKHNSKFKNQVDSEVSDLMKECQKKGTDPKQVGIPLGDNCSGYPVLKYVPQGYDLD